MSRMPARIASSSGAIPRRRALAMTASGRLSLEVTCSIGLYRWACWNSCCRIEILVSTTWIANR